LLVVPGAKNKLGQIGQKGHNLALLCASRITTAGVRLGEIKTHAGARIDGSRICSRLTGRGH
jgi:hypothetical protein